MLLFTKNLRFWYQNRLFLIKRQYYFIIILKSEGFRICIMSALSNFSIEFNVWKAIPKTTGYNNERIILIVWVLKVEGFNMIKDEHLMLFSYLLLSFIVYCIFLIFINHFLSMFCDKFVCYVYYYISISEQGWYKYK